MVLETTYTTAGGTAVLTDALAVGRNERGHDLGTHSPSMLLRRLACTGGEIEVEVSYAPRPEYGARPPHLVPVPGGLAARGGADRLLLSTPVSFDAGRCAPRPPGSGWPPGRPPSSRSATGRWPGPPLAPWTAQEITAPAGRHGGGLAILVGDSPEL